MFQNQGNYIQEYLKLHLGISNFNSQQVIATKHINYLSTKFTF